MTLSIEVLPAPFGPMMARISPLRMSNETSVIAFTPPNDERDVLDRQQHLAGRDRRRPRGALMRAFSMRLPATGYGLHVADRDARARCMPLRPSSNVTSVEMSASFEPS